MRRHVRYLLLYGYYYARLIGIFAFAIDQRTGKWRVHTSRGITLYSLMANLCVVGKVKFMYNPKVIELLRQRMQPLHLVIYFVATFMRAASVLITIAFAWKRRPELMTLIREFLRLRSDYFGRRIPPAHLERRLEWLIAQKFLLAILGDICTLAMVRDLLRDTFTPDVVVTVASVALVGSYMSMALNLYYCSLCLVNFYFHWLNLELLRIMRYLRWSCSQHRRRPIPGAFITLCCQFSDEMDALFAVHNKLWHLWQRFNVLLDIQGACNISIFYLNSINIVYLCYVLSKSEAYFFRLSPVGMGFLCCALVLYYWDLQLYISAMDEMLQAYARTAKLLQRHYLALPLLDVRLEHCVACFTLQVAVDPLEHNMRGLFKFTLPFVFSLFISSIVNSIILVQYDYQYY